MSSQKKVDLLVGAQWGDEGKGKVVDMLGSEVDVFVRQTPATQLYLTARKLYFTCCLQECFTLENYACLVMDS